MDRFETKGVDYLYNCKNIAELDATKSYSCRCCERLPRFLYKKCGLCPIEITHDQMVAYFADANKQEVAK